MWKQHLIISELFKVKGLGEVLKANEVEFFCHCARIAQGLGKLNLFLILERIFDFTHKKKELPDNSSCPRLKSVWVLKEFSQHQREPEAGHLDLPDPGNLRGVSELSCSLLYWEPGNSRGCEIARCTRHYRQFGLEKENGESGITLQDKEEKQGMGRGKEAEIIS